MVLLVKKLSFTILAAALSAVLFLGIKVFPTFLFVAVPLTVTGARLGMSWSLIGGVLASAALYGATRDPRTLLFTFCLLPMAVITGENIRRRTTVNTMVFLGVMIAFTIPILSGMEVWDALLPQGTHWVEPAVIFNVNLWKLTVAQGAELRATLNKIAEFIQQAYPALILCSLLVIGWINIRMSLWCLSRLGEEVSPAPFFSRWRLPDLWIWGLIAGFYLFSAGRLFQWELLSRFGINVLTVFTFIYLLAGMSVAAHFLERRHESLLWVFIFIMIIGAEPRLFMLAILIIIGIGAFDFYFDFRKRLPPLNRQS